MKLRVEVISDRSVRELAKHVEKILNNPYIEVVEVHYSVASDFYKVAFIHYRDKEEWEIDDE